MATKKKTIKTNTFKFTNDELAFLRSLISSPNGKTALEFAAIIDPDARKILEVYNGLSKKLMK